MKPFRTLHRPAAAFFALLLPSVLHAAERVTVLYDAFSDSKEITSDWGFSALVRSGFLAALSTCALRDSRGAVHSQLMIALQPLAPRFLDQCDPLFH